MTWSVTDGTIYGRGGEVIRQTDEPALWGLLVQIARVEPKHLVTIATMVEMRREEEEAGYDSDKAALERIEELIDYAKEHGA